ncbi:MAG: hypothetical protein BWY52_00037 [Chloroflexi bacterium ADurb.Bin325]|nr:MAG: hypothetical protein BWY52_00037 [Chloroflexi bacterium ADurb.Bin325]
MGVVQGKVTIAPLVLTTIVKQTTLDQRGVRRLAPIPPRMRSLRAGATIEDGIAIMVGEQGVQVEVHVVADNDSNMLKLGSTLQAEITRALEEMVGMPVVTVDVYIDDVAMPGADSANAS